MAKKKERMIPVYTTKGDVEAYMIYPHLYNRLGEWIGWVTKEREVYSVFGIYVGWLTGVPRILRKKTYNYDKPRKDPPSAPRRLSPPGLNKLPPMMPELGFDTLDVLQEDPDLLPTLDSGEHLEDMD